MQKNIDNYIEKLENWIIEAFEKKDKYLFQDPAYDLLDEIRGLDNRADFLEPIFLLIERCPDIDYGGPGPFGTFIEEYYKNGYEEQLISSLKRKPMPYTVYLLNRLCNDKTHPNREQYVALLKTFANSDFLDDYWKQVISEY